MLCNKITLYFSILSLYRIQWDNIYEIKEKKKDNNIKTQLNHISWKKSSKFQYIYIYIYMYVYIE